MKNIKSIFVTGVLAASLVGCASTPPIEEMSQLNGEQLTELLVGNTWTGRRDFGRWAEYFVDDANGIGKAWGDWGSEMALSVHNFSEDGVWCSTYPEQTHEWTGPDHEYCGVVLVDEAGVYYGKVTKNTSKPEREGKIYRSEVKPGNHYDLSM